MKKLFSYHFWGSGSHLTGWFWLMVSREVSVKMRTIIVIGSLDCVVLNLSVVSDSLQPVDCSPPGCSVHGKFSRQEYCNRLPCPPPGDLSNSGIEPRSPILLVSSLPSEQPGKGLTGPENQFANSLTWLVARGLSSLPHTLLHRAAYGMVIGFPRGKIWESDKTTKMETAASFIT